MYFDEYFLIDFLIEIDLQGVEDHIKQGKHKMWEVRTSSRHTLESEIIEYLKSFIYGDFNLAFDNYESYLNAIAKANETVKSNFNVQKMVHFAHYYKNSTDKWILARNLPFNILRIPQRYQLFRTYVPQIPTVRY